MLNRPLTPLTLTGSLLSVALLLWALPRLTTVLFTVGLALLFALALDSPVSALSRRGVPRSTAVAVVVLGLLGAAVAGAVLVGPRVVGQLRELAAGHGGLTTLLIERVNEIAATLPIEVPEITGAWLTEQFSGSSERWTGMLAGVGAGLSNVVIAAVLAVWGVTSPARLRDRSLRFIVPARRAQVAELAGKVEARLRRWIVGQLTVMAAVGAGSYVVFRLVGVPFPELFAVLAFLLEAVPLIGVLLASAGPVLMLLVSDPGNVVWLIVGILVVQQAEDRFLIPRVMGKAVELPEALVLLSVLTFGMLFGVGGMVLAMPVTAALVTIHDELTARREQDAGADPEQAGHVEAVEASLEPEPAEDTDQASDSAAAIAAESLRQDPGA